MSAVNLIAKNCLSAFEMGEKEEAVRLLLSVNNPHEIKDVCSRTILHWACLHGWNEIVRNLISEYPFNPQCVDTTGNTPLHDACLQRGNLEIVQFLVKMCECDPMSKNDKGDTPLFNVWEDPHIIQYLIIECQHDLTCKSSNDNTPLHVACRCIPPSISAIEYILAKGKINPLCRNKKSKTPLMLVHRSYKDTVKKIFAKFGRIQISHPVNSYVNIVILGNPGVGKSTLAQVIIQRSNSVFASIRGLFQYVKGVDFCTAGIIPSKLEHRELGNVILHDSAGQSEYYSSHIAVLENLLHGSAAVFIIVVSLSEKEVYKHLHHWLTIVENKSHNAVGQCHVVTVASHIDEVKQRNIFDIYKELEQILLSRLSQHSSIVNCGFIPLDCRRLVGGLLSSFINNLSSACQSIRTANTREISLYCHMLYAVLKEQKIGVYSLDELMNVLAESEEHYIPLEIEKVTELLTSLHATGLVVFLRNNHNPGSSWIVSEKGILLAEVNGVLFAPDVFNNSDIASNTGIITLSTISRLFPQYPSDMLVLFLQYMELCEEVRQDFVSSAIRNDNSSDDMVERLLFFPALIRNTERPYEISGTLQFGWCLECSNPHHFFLPRFLHVLLLHLAFQYTLPKSVVSRLQRRCFIWTSGIQWWDTCGVQSLVELVDNSQCVLLLMSCQEGSKDNMLCLCKQLISEILTLQKQLCPSLKVQEFVIDPSQLCYPIQKPSTLALYDIELIALCIIQKELFVLNTEGDKKKKVSDLFPFESIQPDTLSVFAGRNPEKIAENLRRDPAIIRKLSEQSGSHKRSSYNVLTRHLSEITDVVLDPEKLANDLHSAGLITFHMKDKVLTTSSYPRYEKVSILLINIWRLLRHDNDAKKLVILCDVLKKQNDDCLTEIAQNILKELGFHQDLQATYL